MFSASILLLLLTILPSPAVHGILLCQNGATFDAVRYECICTAHYHGTLCEVSFFQWDPCSNWSSVPVLKDADATHRFGHRQLCDDSPGNRCIDFSVIVPSWYRLKSPAGNYLISQCPTGRFDCGSSSPYILADEVSEDNANRILSRARAYRYRTGLRSGCYLQGDTSYPVRILKCSTALTLYYLQPLPSTTGHYCIGDKRQCDVGLTSIDGTGFEPCIGSSCLPRMLEDAQSPSLRIDYQKQSNGLYRSFFNCTVFSSFGTNETDGVRYRVQFELTFRNGTTVPVSRCQWQNESIADGQNKTFQCKSELVLLQGLNVYGGSLMCRVQARCSTAGSQYDTIPMISNSHGFFFRYWFSGGIDVIKPGEPVSLCISSINIPVLEQVTFFVSVGRQQIMLNDRIEVSVVRRDGNESLECGFKMMNVRYKEKIMCQEMTLYNHDPENRVPLGLTRAEQISVIKVNISFQSSADGLFTYYENGIMYLQRIQTIQLKVDLTSLQTDVKTYLHIYTDPYVKPADKSYSSTFKLDPPSGQSFSYHTLLQHKLLPYEIQVKIQRMSSSLSVVTDIAIKYCYYIIHIYGTSFSGTIQSPVVSELLPRGVSRNPIALKPDGLPQGVTVENVGHAMRVRFDLYGTILYIWGFMAGSSTCSTFIMETSSMSNACRKGSTPIWSRIVLDVSLVPGFYDTPSMVSGLIYGNFGLLDSPKDILLSGRYLMKPTDISGRMQPTEVLGICSCQGVATSKSNCFVSLGRAGRQRREAPELQPPVRPSPTPNNLRPQLFTRTITQQEADEFCNKFIELQLSKSVSTDICSETKDPTGESDYISQFKLICSQYASTLGTFDFSQSLFNSMLGMCYKDLTYNATVVRENSTKIETLVENICPSNCSYQGRCVNGECECNDGFWGRSCELTTQQRDELPINITLLQRDIFCPSNSCSAAYLSVSPFVKSADSVCNIVVNSSLNFTEPSEYISGDIVKCDLSRQHAWLVSEVRMFSQLQIAVSSAAWESSNQVVLLLHQAACGGRPVTCDESTMACTTAHLAVDVASGSWSDIECLPAASASQGALPPLIMLLALWQLLFWR